MKNLFGAEPYALRGEGDARLAGLEALAADTGWIVPTLLNSWVSYDSIYGPPAYRRKAGVVYLRGLIKDGTLSVAAFTLPAGFRPSAPTRLFVCHSNAGINRVDIESDGDVLMGPGDATWTSLNNIVFIADG